MNPSPELRRQVTQLLLGKPYSGKGSKDDISSFNCWSCVWHYLRLAGLVVPYNPYMALKEFKEIGGRPAWRDVLTYSVPKRFVPHCGVMETSYLVLHCDLNSNVVREEVMLPPWNTAKILRHVSLI